MKIAINGEIIDTKDIYKISKIKITKHYFPLFCQVSYEIHQYKNYSNKVIEINVRMGGRNKHWESESLLRRAISILNMKISRHRDSIIKIWSENQSEIPQFNI